MTRNEAAERLRNGEGFDNIVTFSNLLDAALAAERRATVERIRVRLDEIDIRYDNVDAILDEEAAR